MADAPATHPKIAQTPRYAEDLHLVHACVNGERTAWQALLERYEVTIHYAILNTMRGRGHKPSSDYVADLECDFVLALAERSFGKLARYSGRCKLGHWLKVVASNFTIDRLRQHKRIVSLDQPEAGAIRATLNVTKPSPRDVCEQRQNLTRLRMLYQELSDTDREFIELYVFDELSFPEIAERMNTTVGAVYARKNRVRKKLLELAREQNFAS